MLKVLGAIDFVAGLILIFMGSGVSSPHAVLIFFAVVLLLKSLLGMLRDFASWIDFLSGAFFWLSVLITIPGIILIVLGILECQKGIFSFIEF